MLALIMAAGIAAGPADFRTQPPTPLQKPVVATIWFADADDVSAWCRERSGVAGACMVFDTQGRATIVVPHPCRFGSDYALILCHEIGHANGWPRGHNGGYRVSDAPHPQMMRGRQGISWRENTPTRSVAAWCASDPKTGACADGLAIPRGR